MIQLPQNSQWKSAHNGDLFGSLVRSKNLAFTKDGYLQLARKTMGLYTTDDDSDFGIPLVILSDSNLFYAITSGNAFSFSIPDTGAILITELSTTRQPTFDTGTDACWFQGAIHATGGTDMNDFDGSSWHNGKRVTDLNSAYPHPLCSFESRQTLLIGDGNVVRQFSSSRVEDTSNKLSLPSEYVVTGIRFKQNTVYIATRHVNGQEARLFTWTGSGTQFNAGYGVGADWIYSLCEYKNGIALITSAGELRYFNGGGFESLDKLPVYYTPYSWASSAATVSLVGNVANRGMQASGENIYIGINGNLRNPATQGPGQYLPSMPSGIWEYDPQVGLFHKAGYTTTKYQALIPSGLSSNILTFATTHQASTGDPVLCSIQGGITGTTAAQIYYAIVTSTTALKLALSPADALAGYALTLSGSPSTDNFVFARYESTGAGVAINAGPVHVLSRLHPNLFHGTELLFGGRAENTAMVSKSALMSLGMGRNRGYFVTPRIPATQVKETFQKLISMMTPLRLSTDQLVIKYRTREKFGLPSPLAFSSNATWTSTTTFTFDSTGRDFKSAAIGDEVEIVTGAGAGYTAHITDINSTTPSLYQVTIDEAIPITAGNKMDFIVDNWTKRKVLASTDNDNADGFADLATAAKKSTWIQFKIELRGYDVSIESLQSISAPDKLSQ